MVIDRLWPSEVRYRARRDLRTGWHSLLTFSILVGFFGGALIACVAAARRTDSAFDRLRAATHSTDVFLAPTCAAASCGGKLEPIDPAAVEAVAGIEAAVEVFIASGRFETADGRVIQESVGDLNEVGLLASADDRWLRTIDVPVVVAGRMPDPSNGAEVVLTKDVATDRGLSIGDRLFLTIDFEGEEPRPDHDLELDVVGIVLHPIAVRPSSAAAYFSAIFGSADLVADLQAKSFRGSAIATTFDAGLGTEVLAGTPFAEEIVFDLEHQSQVIGDGTDNDTFALLAIALIGGIGSFAVLAPLVMTASRRAQRDGRHLRALGFTRRDLLRRSTLHGLALGIGAAVISTMVALIASRWAPIGEAHRFEPASGLDVDPMVLAGGTVLIVALTFLVVVAGGWSDSRPVAISPRVPVVSRVIDAVRLGPTGALATRVAFGRPGATRVGVGSFAAIVVGVSGIVGALTFLTGLHHLESTPRLVGADYDLFLFHDLEEDIDPTWGDRQVESLLARPEVVGASAGTFYPISAYRVDDVDVRWVVTYGAGSRSAPPFTVTEGRAPTADDEILVHPALRRELGEIGDVVSLGVATGPADESGQATFVSLPFTLVGAGPIPVISEFDSTVAITLAGLRRLIGPEHADNAIPYVVTVQLRDDLDSRATADALVADGVLDPSDVAEQSDNLARDMIGLDLDGVDRVPSAVAVLLAILGACVMTVTVADRARMWRPRIAIHRTLGLSSASSAVAVVLASLAILFVCLVIAVPLGITAGRALWLRHAAGLGVVREAPVPWTELGLLFALTLAISIAVASVPAWRAARQSLASTLRTE